MFTPYRSEYRDYVLPGIVIYLGPSGVGTEVGTACGVL